MSAALVEKAADLKDRVDDQPPLPDNPGTGETRGQRNDSRDDSLWLRVWFAVLLVVLLFGSLVYML